MWAVFAKGGELSLNAEEYPLTLARLTKNSPQSIYLQFNFHPAFILNLRKRILLFEFQIRRTALSGFCVKFFQLTKNIANLICLLNFVSNESSKCGRISGSFAFRTSFIVFWIHVCRSGQGKSKL